MNSFKPFFEREKPFMAAEDYLKTQTVAEALGLSVSTVKRWVDSGMIHAIRTAGKHRLIPRSEAVRVAREMGLDVRGITRLGGVSGGELCSIEEATCDRLYQLLRDGHVQQAKLFIHSVYASGPGAVVLTDQLIRPVMARIGHGWMVGSLDIYQEHQASHVVAAAITEILERVSKERVITGPLALGAVTEGDPYVLSSLLSELVLRELGWEVRNLGVNLPLRSLANATLQYRPKLAVLSINYLRDQDRFLREYSAFYETATAVNTAVIVGGQALDESLRSRLLYTAYGDRMAHLAEFARQLAPTSAQSGIQDLGSERSDRSVIGLTRLGGL
ncbi:MAG: excisionase family DNA-binding protein [Isosphaeraceae bacterium]